MDFEKLKAEKALDDFQDAIIALRKALETMGHTKVIVTALYQNNDKTLCYTYDKSEDMTHLETMSSIEFIKHLYLSDV